MNDAMKDCCDNVWAIVEIIGPSEGFECTLFKGTGGTQYLSPEPSAEESSGEGNFLRKSDVEYDKLKEKGTEMDDKQIDNKEYRSQNLPVSNATSSRMNDAKVKDEDPILNVVELRALMGLGPSITVRMLPSAVPDTRNFEYVMNSMCYNVMHNTQDT